MRTKIKKGIWRMLCAGMALLLPFLAGGCKDSDNDGPGKNKVFLSFNTALVNSTLSRADATEWKQDPERMHTLRIIIVNGKQEVEYNYPLNFDQLDMTRYEDPGMSYGNFGEIQFLVTPNDTKTIYLLANAEELSYKDETSSIDWSKKEFVSAWVKEPKDLVLQGYGSTTNLPMTAVHQIKVGNKNVDLTKSPLYIVPVANKLELTFQNNRTTLGGEIIITGWSLDQVADCSYLLPHVDETTFEANKQPTGNWMQWMKENCEATEKADAWLTEYSIPDGTTHKSYECLYEDDDVLTLSADSEEPTSIPPIYIPESQYNQNTNNGLQQYTLHVTTKEGNETKTYSALLPNLGSLFRNTHVKIDVTFNEAGLSLEVDLYPYTGVDLDPDFGIDVPAEGETETPGEQN